MATLVPITPDPAALVTVCTKAAELRQAYFALAARVAASPALLQGVRDAIAAGNGNLSPELHTLNDMTGQLDAMHGPLGDFFRRFPTAEAYMDAAPPGAGEFGRIRRLGEYGRYENAYRQVDEAMQRCENKYQALIAEQEEQP